jgi:ribosome-associated translation inhibitor RaiA
MDVELKVAEGELSREEMEAAREKIASLDRYTDKPPVGARLTLRPGGGGRPRRLWVADAHMPYDGRVLAAHTAAPSAEEAAERAAERLRRQLRRVVDEDVARRNEPDEIRAALESLPTVAQDRPEAGVKPPEERAVVVGHTYPELPMTTEQAVADLLDLDREFVIFRHARTGEDVLVYRRPDGRIGLMHPPGSALADENDVVVPEASPHPAPLTIEQARKALDESGLRFLYFTAAEDGRGRVLYLRHDGDYGLVAPA